MMTATRLDATILREQARGKWRAILSFHQIAVPASSKQHGPCPACGGKDRFRFDDKEGRGTWFCNQCRPRAGDGFALIRKIHGCSFPEAFQIVAEALNLSPLSYVPRQDVSKPIKVNRVALAFRFELAALDRRLRAERIVEAGKKLDVASLNDAELDRALHHAANAHTDVQRAELFEGAADDLQMKEWRGHEQTRRIA